MAPCFLSSATVTAGMLVQSHSQNSVALEWTGNKDGQGLVLAQTRPVKCMTWHNTQACLLSGRCGGSQLGKIVLLAGLSQLQFLGFFLQDAIFCTLQEKLDVGRNQETKLDTINIQQEQELRKVTWGELYNSGEGELWELQHPCTLTYAGDNE